MSHGTSEHDKMPGFLSVGLCSRGALRLTFLSKDLELSGHIYKFKFIRRRWHDKMYIARLLVGWIMFPRGGPDAERCSLPRHTAVMHTS